MSSRSAAACGRTRTRRLRGGVDAARRCRRPTGCLRRAACRSRRSRRRLPATSWCSRIRSTNFGRGLTNVMSTSPRNRRWLAASVPAYPPPMTTTCVRLPVMMSPVLSVMPSRHRRVARRDRDVTRVTPPGSAGRPRPGRAARCPAPAGCRSRRKCAGRRAGRAGQAAWPADSGITGCTSSAATRTTSIVVYSTVRNRCWSASDSDLRSTHGSCAEK